MTVLSTAYSGSVPRSRRQSTKSSIGSPSKKMPLAAAMRPAQPERVQYSPPARIAVDTCEIIVVRHGETTWNRDKRLQGQADSDLNSLGIVQAAAVADRLAKGECPFAAVYSSDLRRAVDTANQIAGKSGMQTVQLKDLRERHLGVLQGLRKDEAVETHPGAFEALLSRDVDLAIPGGGESQNALMRRVANVFEMIALRNRGKRVVVVSHGAVIAVLHKFITGSGPSGRVVNASINLISLTGGSDWKVISWGDIKHLDGLGFERDAFGGGSDSG